MLTNSLYLELKDIFDTQFGLYYVVMLIDMSSLDINFVLMEMIVFYFYMHDHMILLGVVMA